MLAVDIMPLIWTLIMVLSVIHEALTLAYVALWFVPSAMIAILLSLCGADVWISTIFFIGASAVMLFLSRMIFRRNVQMTDFPIGGEGIVVRELDIEKTGIVLVFGQEWQASAYRNKKIRGGCIVKIKGVVGQTLICKKK